MDARDSQTRGIALGWAIAMVAAASSACTASHSAMDAEAGAAEDAGVDSADVGVVDGGQSDACTDPLVECACYEWRPTVAADPVNITGTVWAGWGPPHSGREMGVRVAAISFESGATLAEDLSDGRGHFTLAVPTGGVPVGVYLEATGDGVVPHTDCTLPDLTDDVVWDLYVETPSVRDAAYVTAGVVRHDGAGTALVGVYPCTGVDRAGSLVESDVPADLRYIDATGAYSAAPMSTWMGFVQFFNVSNPSGGAVEYSVHAGDVTWARERCPTPIGGSALVFLHPHP